jgi:L-histidine Nalpha-methyltransferase / hercynylcysteine S-oxide synthase
MLIQRAGTGTLPPPGFSVPAWAHLSAQWDTIPSPTTPTVTLGGCTLIMGHDDRESDDLLPANEHAVLGHTFGWDNESPQRAVEVAPFRAEWRPITNEEFLVFMRKMEGKVPMPPSWVEENDEIKVRTLYGPVEMEYAKHWPCLTAYDDLVAYAQAKGGRLPTETELRLFLDTYQVNHAEGANVGFRNWHPLP